MEIKQYAPRYKKAIIDLALKDLKDESALGIVKANLECDDVICFIAFEDNKFKGFILGKPIDKETVFCNYWATKTKEAGILLARQAVYEAKKQGFKYAEFFRSAEKRYYRKEL